MPGYNLTSTLMVEGPAPVTAVDYQRAFSHRDTWAGGDVACPVPLPDGRVLWLHGDTFIGPIPDDGTRPRRMIRNSLVLQDGGRFNMLSGPPDARVWTEPLAHPDERVWLWPFGGVANARRVRILCHVVGAAAGSEFGAWTAHDIAVVNLRSTDWRVTSVQRPPVQTVPGTGWGGMAKIGRYVYVTGWRGIPGRWGTVLARTTLSGLTTTPWRFWDGQGWGVDLAGAARVEFEAGPFGQVQLSAANGGVVASGQAVGGYTHDVLVWRAERPWGPYAAPVAVAGRPLDGWRTYAARVAVLPGAGLTAVWCRNVMGGRQDARLYGPVFAEPDTTLDYRV